MIVTLTDDVGRTIHLQLPAQRIVSLVPSLTETLFTFGAGEQVVGITRFCIEPPEAAQRATLVGGCKNPDLEAIRALSPDVVIVNAEENRREDFDALVALGITIYVTNTRRVSEVGALLQQLARLSGREREAAPFVNELKLAARPADHSALRPRVFCPIWKNPWMGFNADTYAHDMIERAGGANLLASQAERYCRIELEQIAELDPELILLPDEPYVFRQKDLAEMSALHPTTAWRTVPAGPTVRALRVSE